MEHLLVSHWYRNARYEIQSINGVEYIVPCEYGLVYDPIKIENNMISDANLRLLVRKINVHENEDGSLDATLEFNGDFKDTSTVCFEIND